MHSLTTSAAIAAVAFAGLSSAARTVKIENRCSTKVWPAVSPFANQQEAYGDSRGWEMTPGSQKSITVPNTFTGRIWGRQGCVGQGDGTLVCVTGACPNNALECEDGALGTGTNLDLRLSTNNNGQYDWFMLTNGGGWSMPVSIKPEGPGCQSVSCTPDLDACPDDKLKLQDSYGATLGCMSSCYAGIGDTAVQCCSGDYQNAKSCTPDLIEYYSYFKSKACEHAYAYFQDSRSGQPTVDYLCPSDGDPGYVFTFCPDGDGKAEETTAAKTKTGDAEETGTAAGADGDKTATEDSQPTGTGGGNQPTDVPAITSAASLNATAAETSQGGSAASTGLSDSSFSANGTATSSAASSSGTSESATADEDTEAADGETEGLTTTQLYWIAGVGAVIAIVAIGLVVFCVKRRNQQQAQAAQQAADVEQRAATQPMAQAGTGRNPAQYAPVRSRSNRSQTALLSDSDQHTESDAPTSSDDDDHPPPQRRGSTASRSSSRR
ncbi:hypothetical protein JCM6882_006394 [Rhodosporidiobolus microsporus]